MRITIAFFVLLMIYKNTDAQLRLPSVIASGMVLQQNDSVNIWGWANPDEPITINTGWDNQDYKTTTLNTGKWKRKIKTPAAGGPYTIKISGWFGPLVLSDVMIGEVWLCSGQSNMEWNYYAGAKNIKEELPTCYNKNIRFYHIPRASAAYPQDDVPATWKVCDSNTLKNFSAVGYFFGKKLNSQLNVPIGLINASWGGTPAEAWSPADVISNNPVLAESANKLTEVPWGPVKRGLLFNGMINPITSFSIAGAIWYQGEANVVNSNTYAQLLTSMIDAWRSSWQKQFPFYYVQIAPYNYGGKDEGALLQAEQTKVMQHPGTGMVVITDLVDSVTNIHPSNKLDVGNRLANWALAETYRRDGIAYKSPQIKKAVAVNNNLVLEFKNAPNGLIAKDKKITGFYIAGNNGEWLPAEAKIEKDKITVRNKSIPKPLQVSFGFGNTIIGNVFSKEGLPLCPFRININDTIVE
ncbi:MAG: sialate O-acetylesterase [Ferruginibacter sp.]